MNMHELYMSQNAVEGALHYSHIFRDRQRLFAALKSDEKQEFSKSKFKFKCIFSKTLDSWMGTNQLRINWDMDMDENFYGPGEHANLGHFQF